MGNKQKLYQNTKFFKVFCLKIKYSCHNRGKKTKLTIVSLTFHHKYPEQSWMRRLLPRDVRAMLVSLFHVVTKSCITYTFTAINILMSTYQAEGNSMIFFSLCSVISCLLIGTTVVSLRRCQRSIPGLSGVCQTRGRTQWGDGNYQAEKKVQEDLCPFSDIS